MSKPDPKLTIVWFRRDLRLEDNEALVAASERGRILPVYIWSEEEEKPWAPGGAARWWIHYALESLDATLRKRRSKLIIRSGNALDALRSIIKETGATAVYWNRLYDPHLIARDSKVKASLQKDGIEAKSFAGSLLFEPTTIRNKQDRPFQVFSPFWRHLESQDEPVDPLPIPKISSPDSFPKSQSIEDLSLLPKIPWDAGFKPFWEPGIDGAHKRLDLSLESVISGYIDQRNRPDIDGTSRLSPYIHHGELSVRQVWKAVRVVQKELPTKAARDSVDWYLRELGWREFNHHLLFHFPHTPTEPLREDFKKFPWRKSKKMLAAWQRGQTGYPVVDAGMRQLWETGWMHNRVRMIVASFLVKHLLLPWQEGAAWFWDTLVDADLANNTMGWQWAAGCGADAAPYFRIFNPVSQAENFDPDGAYIRRYVPELESVKGKAIFSPRPSDNSLFTGDAANYPGPIVDHKEAREAALDAFASIKKK